MATTRLGPYGQAVIIAADDRAGADHRDHVAGADVAVEHADLEPGGQDVGQEQHLLVAEPLGDLVPEAVVGEQDAGQLGLGAVDQVAEDPAAAALALPTSLAAVEAAPAGEMQETRTRSPWRTLSTASPVSTTVPTASWPGCAPPRRWARRP